MKLLIRVKAGCRTEEIDIIDQENWVVKVRQAPIDGKANQAVVEMIAKYLKIPKSRVVLLKGEKSKSKTFEIVEL